MSSARDQVAIQISGITLDNEQSLSSTKFGKEVPVKATVVLEEHCWAVFFSLAFFGGEEEGLFSEG